MKRKTRTLEDEKAWLKDMLKVSGQDMADIQVVRFMREIGYPTIVKYLESGNALEGYWNETREWIAKKQDSLRRTLESREKFGYTYSHSLI